MNATMTVVPSDLCPHCLNSVTAVDVEIIIGGQIKASFWHYPKPCVVVYVPEPQKRKKRRSSEKRSTE